jgi:hypothetical protein
VRAAVQDRTGEEVACHARWGRPIKGSDCLCCDKDLSADEFCIVLEFPMYYATTCVPCAKKLSKALDLTLATGRGS